jgi:hypothetical protein
VAPVAGDREAARIELLPPENGAAARMATPVEDRS